MKSTDTSKYTAPVNQLLTYGKPDIEADEWQDYLAVGLKQEHIPELIQMATDDELMQIDEERPEAWAPIHALRALGQLRAEEAVKPLLSIFSRPDVVDEWFIEEIPESLGLIGPAALPILKNFIADETRDNEARYMAVPAILKIANKWPETRAEGIDILSKQLEKFTENDPELNAFLIETLNEMHAVEAAPLMESAFEANVVDTMIAGTWDDAQLSLGLITKEEYNQKALEERAKIATALPSVPAKPAAKSAPIHAHNLPYAHEHTHTHTHDEHAEERSIPANRARVTANKKAKIKMAKKSRKQNRRR
ncbi:hypothetical protein KDA_35320 [Dictyobacter alpinus]|uniref:HEAT repeat domain-containing protein n=1 Tax=Dictyobacter alpinus TaxID=2014873 RepID=A0A402B9K4_9CHLR|nr:DUF1186 domain-containing protein [Dictyobacter alpinus]GCE28048.1 hypothetical protein KDA_35320 [Dictyobacter alpinus]